MSEQTPPPPDLQYVLSGIPTKELKAWLVSLGESEPPNQASAVFAASKRSSTELASIYDSNLFRSGRVAVTWFRNVARPSEKEVRDRVPSVASSDGDDRRLSLVWITERQDDLAIRLAYHEAERLVRIGLDYEAVEQLGIATMIWRTIAGQAVLETHCQSLRLPALLALLMEVQAAGTNLEVLDIRSNASCDKLRKELDARYTDADFDIDDPEAVEEGGSFRARPDRDLAESTSIFATYADNPGRGRTLEFKDGNRLVRLKVSQRDYSAVVYNLDLNDTALVFEKALKSGVWTSYP